MSSNLAQGVKVIESSALFSAAWYSSSYPDVALSGLSPAEHYFRLGGHFGYDPSLQFSTNGYLKSHPDVAKARMNALFHYEMHGRKEGRRIVAVISEPPKLDPALLASLIDPQRPALPEKEARAYINSVVEQKLTSTPHRLYQTFDAHAARKFVDALMSLPSDVAAIRDIKATVIMPTFNRADKIEGAIRSVLGQSHTNLELIVIDDGSSDATLTLLQKYLSDPRFRLISNTHQGVSAARNSGLEMASGEVIFYLDSDNLWNRDFVRLMLIGLQVSKADCAYGASRLQTASGQLIGYRGEPFDWQACVDGNYIDMNVFCHRRKLVKEVGGFDTALQRMVDWDLILRYSKDRGASYFPIIGCIYLEDSTDRLRITTSQPYIFRKIAQEKNLRSSTSTQEVLKTISFNIALKTCAPYETRMAWGDYHYAESLKDALTALGHNVRIDFYGKWYDPAVNEDDLVIALRGLSEYTPRHGQLSLMWNISHPDQVSYKEYQAYHGVFVASRSYAELLSKILGRDVQPLLQCTDSRRFSFTQHAPKPEDKGVFVGNTRDEYRSIVKWAVESEIDFSVYGQGWEPFLPSSKLKGQSIDNKRLHKTYAKASFVLNDHWASMRDFGFVSNRVFDVLGCGGQLVSDDLPALENLFGDAVVRVKDKAEFESKIRNLPRLRPKKRKAIAKLVHEHHSFDTRAQTICNWLNDYLSGQAPLKGTAVASPSQRLQSPPRRRVGLLLQSGQAWPTSSAFIRLIGPLTTEAANAKIEVIYLKDVNDPQIDKLDACIVQRVAVSNMADAQRLIERLKAQKTPLYVDNDDAFFLIPIHIEQDRILRHLMAAADEVWFSTQTLAGYYDEIKVNTRIVPNALDPRFWRDYRNSQPIEALGMVTRFVYMGTATHNEDFKLVYPAFEKLAQNFPNQFTLTLVGVMQQPPQQPWLRHRLPPNGQGSYPLFTRWLMENCNYDVGIAPLQKSQFNRAKSDIKFLDYSAAGLLSLVSEGPVYEAALQSNLALGCANSPEDWYQTMAQIISDPQKHLEMRKRAAEYIWQARSTFTAKNPIVDILTR